MSVNLLDGLGRPVYRATGAIANNTTANLFTVSGGAVLVTAMLGIVTTTLTSTANLSLGTTAPSSTTSIATATALANNAAGTCILPIGSAGKSTALVIAGAVFTTAPPFFTNPFVVAAGNITHTTSAASTGSISWYLWWTPVDSGASVVAA